MKNNGIKVVVADYCAFCGDFVPDVEKNRCLLHI